MLDPQRQQALLDRIRLIPIVATLKMQLERLDAGHCRIRAPYRRVYDGVFESFHGGLLMTIADSAACFAILTQTDPQEVLTTTDMNIRFLAPCRSDVIAAANVIKLGRTLCPVAVDLTDEAGKTVAVAQVTYMRLDKMPRR